MKIRVLSMVLSLAALQCAGSVQAQIGNLKSDEARRNEEVRHNAVQAEQELARQFADFQKSLHSLKNRLERSTDAGDRDRAAQLQKVLDECDNAGIRIKFVKLQEHLRKPVFSLNDYKEAAVQTEDLAKDFVRLVDLFRGHNNRLAEEIKNLKDKHAHLIKILKEENRILPLTQQGMTDKNQLVDLQDKNAKDAKDLKNAIDGKDGKKEPKTSDGGPAKPGAQIQKAYEEMKKAAAKLKEGDNKGAAEKEIEAIDALNRARNELEDRLQILRERELEMLLANLKTRLERMRAMQIDVLSNAVDGTVATHQAVQLNADKRPTDAQVQASLRLAAKQKDIIAEADKTRELLENEGSAVAMTSVLEQVREDMRQAHRRLDSSDVGVITQAIEKSIIASLEDMIKALGHKQDQIAKKNEEGKPKPPRRPNETDPPPDQKLLDHVAELKLIRAMQVRLNDRTKLYSEQFPGQEQPADPSVRREMGDLRDSQERIFDITNKIQKGDNK